MKAAGGQWTGIAIELWGRIAEKLGLHTTFKEYNAVPDMLRAVADGGADAAVAAITVTADREKTVDFTQPYYESGLESRCRRQGDRVVLDPARHLHAAFF